MPTYTVRTPAGRLDAGTRAALAREITHAHTAATGAQGFFAQVVFTELDADQHFVGGAPVAEDLVFVHGQIRSGRSPEQKRALLDALTHAVTATLGVRRRAVWIYLLDLPPTNMVEYGHVLPEAGDERAWLASLETDDRSYLESLGS
jgi:phenylpyruvate tautomerase PptA (4-oxalocrotonate tautomerase family)